MEVWFRSFSFLNGRFVCSMLIFQGVLPQFLTSLIRPYGLYPRYVGGEGTVFHVVLGSLRAVLTPRAPILAIPGSFPDCVKFLAGSEGSF